ncbi:MAG TPA: hypothetical protein VJ949_07935 [Cryomorphaceae bacterium]|nr:hypothetical protein [Cryomorphaceae bacterium]
MASDAKPKFEKRIFWDVDFALFHKEKFSTQYLLVSVPQAISYFADAEDDVDTVSLKGQTWESVKETIKAEVRSFLA